MSSSMGTVEAPPSRRYFLRRCPILANVASVIVFLFLSCKMLVKKEPNYGKPGQQ